jgi:hypothetical protein
MTAPGAADLLPATVDEPVDRAGARADGETGRRDHLERAPAGVATLSVAAPAARPAATARSVRALVLRLVRENQFLRSQGEALLAADFIETITLTGTRWAEPLTKPVFRFPHARAASAGPGSLGGRSPAS